MAADMPLGRREGIVAAMNTFPPDVATGVVLISILLSAKYFSAPG